MGKSISFDIAALILLVVLAVSLISRKMTHDRSNRIFLYITYTAIASTVFDIISVLLDQAQRGPIPVIYIANAGYLITHFLSVPLYLLFVISLTDTWHKLRKNIALQVLLLLPLAVVMLAFVLNTGNHLVFSVENGYTRGPLFGVMYLGTILYVIYVIGYFIRYRTLFGRKDFIAVSAIIPIDLAAMIIQFFFPSVLVEMFCGAIGLLIMSVGLQSPEDYIDTFTHLMKYSAYARDMKRSFYNEKHVYIILINIANFQSIQAMLGFDSTTAVLKRIADHMRRMNRKMHGRADLYYLDNGMFRMVFRGENPEKGKAAAEELNQALKEPIPLNGLNISLEPFVILARCPEEIKDFKTLMSFGADFHVRNFYTGQVMLASRLYDLNQLDIQNNIDRIIEQALEEERFQIYYQPIYSTREERFLSAEALLRLIDPQHGFISPEMLILAAEKSGAIHRIGEFVFKKVCQFIASEEFATLGLDYIEVNLSVAQLMNVDLPDTLFSIMKEYGISPDKINLEVTESVVDYEQRVMEANFEKLTRAGLSFSLDDYGTGYSNIKRVTQLPLKMIKLDKTFANENENPKMRTVLQNTVKMMKDINMEVVVEGVETQEMLDVFLGLQCDFIQGYFFSKPVPRKEFIAFLSDANRKNGIS